MSNTKVTEAAFIQQLDTHSQSETVFNADGTVAGWNINTADGWNVGNCGARFSDGHTIGPFQTEAERDAAATEYLRPLDWWNDAERQAEKLCAYVSDEHDHFVVHFSDGYDMGPFTTKEERDAAAKRYLAAQMLKVTNG